jgi:hypothetical protein
MEDDMTKISLLRLWYRHARRRSRSIRKFSLALLSVILVTSRVFELVTAKLDIC